MSVGRFLGPRSEEPPELASYRAGDRRPRSCCHGWVEIRPEDGSDCLSSQQVTDYRAPQWPGQVVPQQMHLDLVVADLDEGEAAVRARGATLAEVQPGTTYRVFLDPAGHPFCLCLN